MAPTVQAPSPSVRTTAARPRAQLRTSRRLHARPIRPVPPALRALGLCLVLATAWFSPLGQARAQASAPTPAQAPWSAADHSAWADMAAADPAHGRRLHAEHRCAECHARRVGGNGNAIYRPAGRIQRPAALLAMVEMCNTELKLQLFPDDVAALAAALNQDHYRIRPPTR